MKNRYGPKHKCYLCSNMLMLLYAFNTCTLFLLTYTYIEIDSKVHWGDGPGLDPLQNDF